MLHTIIGVDNITLDTIVISGRLKINSKNFLNFMSFNLHNLPNIIAITNKYKNTYNETDFIDKIRD